MYRDDGDQRTREREDSMEDDGRISLWKNRGISILSSSLDSYSFVFFSNCFRALYMISPRDSKLTLILCIYIYICKVSFDFLFFFSTLSYLCRWSHIEKPIKLIIIVIYETAVINLSKRSRQIVSDFFYSHGSITEKNNQVFFIDGRRNIWLKSEA